MRILVCGGRDYTNKDNLFKVLSCLHANEKITHIINGGASGADALSTSWAIENKIPSKGITAKWKDLDAEGAVVKTGRFGSYNCLAGFDRNQRMIDEENIDLVVAFSGGNGTADMVERAEKAGVVVVKEPTFKFISVEELLGS